MIHHADFLYGQGKYGFRLQILAQRIGDGYKYDAHGANFKKYSRKIKAAYDISIPIQHEINMKNKDLIEDIEEILEGIKESETLKFNGCKNTDTIRHAKLIRKNLLDDGLSTVEIVDGGKTIRIRIV